MTGIAAFHGQARLTAAWHGPAGKKTEPWLSASQINGALPYFSYSFHIFPLNLGPLTYARQRLFWVRPGDCSEFAYNALIRIYFFPVWSLLKHGKEL